VSAGDVPELRQGHLPRVRAARRAGPGRGAGITALQLRTDVGLGRYVAAVVPPLLSVIRGRCPRNASAGRWECRSGRDGRGLAAGVEGVDQREHAGDGRVALRLTPGGPRPPGPGACRSGRRPGCRRGRRPSRARRRSRRRGGRSRARSGSGPGGPRGWRFCRRRRRRAGPAFLGGQAARGGFAVPRHRGVCVVRFGGFPVPTVRRIHRTCTRWERCRQPESVPRWAVRAPRGMDWA